MRRIRIDDVQRGHRFDSQRAKRAVDFFEKYLIHTKGRHAGKPFILEDFQRTDIEQVFGWVDEEGNRTIRTWYEEIPKKNGKSELAAGIALKMLFADDEPSAEVYGAAADRDQAGIVFAVAHDMVRANPRLNQLAKLVPSTKRIVTPDGSYYRALSADVAGKHGFNTHAVIFDEVHAQKAMALWEVMTYGAGAARSQPLTMAITTAGVPGDSPVAEMLHEEAKQILEGILPCPKDFYPVMYAADADAPWDSEDTWRSCNPAIGRFLKIESIREEFDRARRRPAEQNSFRRLRLNQWVAQETRWIDMDVWDGCSGSIDLRELRDLPCYIGVDLSTKLDVTAVVAVYRSDMGYVIVPHFFIPRDNLQERPNIESHRYREWEARGYLTTTPGNEVDFDTVHEKIIHIANSSNFRRVMYDPMFAGQLGQQLQKQLGVNAVIPFRQSFQFYTEAMAEFESALLQGRVSHNGNPMLRWMADCVSVKQMPDGRKMPVKPDRLKARKRIDGIVASLMGVFGALRDGSGGSVYERERLQVI